MKKYLLVSCCLFPLISYASINFVIEKDSDIELISADNSEYGNNTIHMSNNVKLRYGDKIIKCDRLTVDLSKKSIEATGNINIEDENGNIVSADNIDIKNKFHDGSLNNAMISMKDKSYMKSSQAEFIGDDEYIMNDVEYSPCYKCHFGDRLTWKIRSDKVTQKDGEICFKNAKLDILDIPILYLPYLTVPGIGVKRKTGFIYPLFSHSRLSGLNLCQRFLYSISDSKELLIKPVFTTRIGSIFWTSYAERFTNGMLDIDTSFAGIKSAKHVSKDDISAPDQNELKKINSNNYRGHIFATYENHATDNIKLSSKLNLVSDKYYLRKVPFIANEDFRLLESNVCAEYFDRDDYTSVKMMYFQTLRADETTSQIPVVLPAITHNSSYDVLSCRLNIDALFLHLNFSNNHITDKMLINSTLRKEIITKSGHTFSLNCTVSSSINRIDFKNAKDGMRDATLTDISPMVGVIWKWPLAISYNTSRLKAVIKPVAGLIYSPTRKINSVYNDPYTSMRFFELNELNFLEVIRSPFSLQINDGTRVPYGILGELYNSKGRQIIDFAIGRSFNISDIKNNVSDIRHKHSNIISNVSVFFTDKLSFFGNSCYSTYDHEFKRIDCGIKYRGNTLEVKSGAFRYIQPKDSIESNNTYNGLHFNVTAKISKNTSIIGGIITGGSDSKILRKNLGLQYANECLSASVMFSQHSFRSGDIRPDRSISIILIFKNLGKMDFKT